LSISPRESAAAELKARALRYLARREHSRAELARKLAPHAPSVQALHALLDELASKQQLSEERYAEERARTLARKFGPAKIRQDLRSKGVADEVIDALAFEDEAGKARALLARKYRGPATSREEQAKRGRFLQARGFSLEVVVRLLRHENDGE
jgi:regulatory protein